MSAGPTCEVCREPLVPSAEEGLLACPRCRDLHLSDSALSVSLSDSEATPVEASRIVFTPAMRERFVMSRIIGRGAMGMVVEAADRELGRKVAIKFLTRREDVVHLARFLQEGRMLSEMRHPHVLPVFDVGEMGGHPYLVCELLDGGTLRDRLDRERRLSPRVLVPLAMSCLSGVAAFHERGVVHRDLKPHNILFDRAGRPKIADLGLAKDCETGPRLTITGTLLGTPKYMSPEQCRGEKATAASDIYSLGVVFYEALAGKPPFDDESLFLMITRHLEDAPPPLRETAPDVPVALAEAVHRALAKDPKDRPASAIDFSNLLKASIEPPKRVPPATVPRPAPPRARGSLVWAGVGTLVALLAISVQLAQRPTRWGPRPPSPRDDARVTRPVRATELAVTRPVLVTQAPVAPVAPIAPVTPVVMPASAPPSAPAAAPSRRPAPASPEPPWLPPTAAARRLWRIAPDPFQHPGPLSALAFHGAQLSTAGPDGTVCWWDAATGERKRTWRPDGARATHAALAAFRPVLACAHEDATVSVWDASTDTPIRIRSEPIAARAVAVSAAGDRVAALSAAGEVWVLGEGRKPVLLAAKGVRSAAFTRSGREVVTREASPAIKVWSADSGALVRLFAVDAGADARLAAVSDEAVYLASGGGLIAYTLTGNRSAGDAPAAQAAAMSADGRQVIAAGSDALVRFDAASGVASEVAGGALAGVAHVAVSEDGRLFAVGASDGVLRAGDAARGLAGRDDPVGTRGALALSSDGRTLALAGSRRTVVVDLVHRKVLAREPAEPGAPWLAVGPAGGWLFCAGPTGLTLRQGGEVRLRTPLVGAGRGATCAAAAADGAVAAGLSGGGALVVPPGGAPVAVRSPSQDTVLAVAIGGSPRMLTTAQGPRGLVRVLDVSGTPRLVREIDAGSMVTHAAVSPDGSRVLTASGFDAIACVSMVDGARLDTWTARYGPDAALLATGSLCAWSDPTGTVQLRRPGAPPLPELPGASPVVRLAASADGRVLASLAADGTVAVWQLPDVR